jgi:hypothetical protein
MTEEPGVHIGDGCAVTGSHAGQRGVQLPERGEPAGPGHHQLAGAETAGAVAGVIHRADHDPAGAAGRAQAGQDDLSGRDHLADRGPGGPRPSAGRCRPS